MARLRLERQNENIGQQVADGHGLDVTALRRGAAAPQIVPICEQLSNGRMLHGAPLPGAHATSLWCCPNSGRRCAALNMSSCAQQGACRRMGLRPAALPNQLLVL